MYSGLLSEKSFDVYFDNFVKSVSVHPPEEFLMLVSNSYHEIESKNYDSRHPEIVQENERLKKFISVFQRNKPSASSINILDYGCGTGIPTFTICKALHSYNSDLKIYAYDPSEKMLDALREKVGDSKVEIELGNNLSTLIGNNKLDLIFSSSVLHHVPNVWKQLQSFNGMLSDNGFLIIMHEPNTYSPSFFQKMAQKAWTRYKRFKKRFGGIGPAPKFRHILDKTSEALLMKKVSTRELSRREIRGLIDIHTINPQKGDFNIGYNGFSRNFTSRLLQETGFKVLEFEYYDAFRSSELNWHLKILSRLLCAANENNALRFSFIAQKRIG